MFCLYVGVIFDRDGYQVSIVRLVSLVPASVQVFFVFVVRRTIEGQDTAVYGEPLAVGPDTDQVTGPFASGTV